MAKKILFYDTETTGLPKSYSAKLSDSDNWPRLVQIAVIVYETNGNKIHQYDTIVKPEGFEIPPEVSRIHGITTERALAEGKELKQVLEDMRLHIAQCDYIAGHNIEFDNNILGAEFFRLNIDPVRPPRIKIDTMKPQAIVNFCKIPSARGGYKWPRLIELHKHLFNCDFSDAHNAAADIEATAKCFWELKRLGIIKLEGE